MFRVAARTLLELGSELISSDIIAFYELIKNGFDAKTTTGVEIHFNIVLRRNQYLSLQKRFEEKGANIAEMKAEVLKALNADAPSELFSQVTKSIASSTTKSALLHALEEAYKSNSIIISDTGTGMSIDDLNKNFLVIGTASRKREIERAIKASTQKIDTQKPKDPSPPFLGEKGIGRLSAMRLGNRLMVTTARVGDKHSSLLEVDWSAFSNLDLMLDEVHIAPKKGPIKLDPKWHGTSVAVSDLMEDWTSDRVRQLANWEFARLTDPFLDQKDRPRIAIFWNRERVPIPAMSPKLLEHAHARVRGSYSIDEGVPKLSYTLEAIDLGFPHPKEVEHVTVCDKDLMALLVGNAREVPDGALTEVGEFEFEAHWYNRRRLREIDSIGNRRTVLLLQEQWSGVMMFRDSFRVFPYGEDADDWLGLDRKALRRSGYILNKTQFIGRVSISRIQNPHLVDQTNREGLRESPEQQVLLGVLKFVIQTGLFLFLTGIEKQYNKQKTDFSEAITEVNNLETRAKAAVKRLKSLAIPGGREVVEDIEQTLFEFAEFADRAKQRISEVEQESRQMIEMAGVGLMVEVVAHELARASENALANLEALRKKEIPTEVRSKLESLRDQMKSLSKRVRILDPLSVAGRQRSETFSLQDLISQTLEAHRGQFERHGIKTEVIQPKAPVMVTAVKGMVVQVVENLISNSKYWMKLRQEREKGFTPTISITVESDPPTVVYEDNGLGIAPDNQEKIFKAFFSLKERSRRRGLGLFIARECAESNGGTLRLDEVVDPHTQRLHRFILELP